MDDHHDGNDDDSSSSSSSSSGSGAGLGEDDDDFENEEGEEDSDDASDDDDEDVAEDDDDEDELRHALALSLVEQAEGTTRLDSSDMGDDEETGPVSTVGTPSGLTTPGNRTPLSEDEVETKHSIEESPLPAMPVPPKTNPYASLLNPKVQDDTDQVTQDSSSFDPSALKSFGFVPAPNVLVCLLTHLNEIFARRKFESYDDTSKSSPKDSPRVAAITGGMGSSLFPPSHPSVKSKISEQRNESFISLQLLVALFLLAVERRNTAIENLKLAVAQEASGNNERGLVGGEEGDDPAIAMALTYIDEDASESKESLEAKGMKRKAAAAKRDAAALAESLRKRSKAWKEQVRLFSRCVLDSMKALRHFLHYMVRSWLQERSGFSPVEYQELLPTTVISKLSVALTSLSQISSKKLYSTILSEEMKEENDDVEDVFMPTKLYQDSILLWGETVPFVYPSVSTQVEVLRSLMAEVSKTKGSAKQIRSLDSSMLMSMSDADSQLHRLHVLCRRLRVSDLLTRFVPSPACYLPESEDESTLETMKTQLDSDDSIHASSLIETIGSASSSFGGLKGELQSLYLALCHRFHVRILLWDGLFACSDSDVDDPAVSLTPSPGDSIRVGLSSSTKLQFDATKCSDSMAIVSNTDSSASVSNSSSVNQRASKVWGTVLSSTSFSPKTGVHRWAVRLDKCERGHVFVGVATAQASVRTYVGGDKYGWGMIGTQALWHDRRKIRGDYGSTFRTGSTIIVTLDTDAGTLSFSSWKDSSSSGSYSIDQVVQNLSSPRRQGQSGGVVEDWGVAFEGLPLDSKLFPAVGLYQRDDRVTLLAVETSQEGQGGSLDLTEGLCYYPPLHGLEEREKKSIAHRKMVRKFNDALHRDGLRYATGVLRHILASIRENRDEFLVENLLPTLASSVCLVPPSVPILSERFSLSLLPHLTQSIIEMEVIRKSRHLNADLFQDGLQEGKWIIRATGSSGSSSDAEEYIVDLSPSAEEGSNVGFHGTGVGTTGKSKNGLVAIFGTVQGSMVHFVEEWTDANDEGFSSIVSDDVASSCVVTGRLSLDGKKFEGTYRNVQYGTSGQIAGMLCDAGDYSKVPLFRLKQSPMPISQKMADSKPRNLSGQALLALGHSHLSTIVGEDSANDNSAGVEEYDATGLSKVNRISRRQELLQCLSMPLLSQCGMVSDQESLSLLFASLINMYGDEDIAEQVSPLTCLKSLQNKLVSTGNNNSSATQVQRDRMQNIDKLDETLCNECGGKGSLSSLCPEGYLRARRLLICVFFHLCQRKVSDEELDGREVIWKSSLKLMEDGVRRAIASDKTLSTKQKAETCCNLFCEISEFLLSLDTSMTSFMDFEKVRSDLITIYGAVTCKADVEFLKNEMNNSSRRSILRLVSINETMRLFDEDVKNPVVVESLLVGLPKILGRAFVETSRQSNDGSSYSLGDDLGGYYLSNLPGASTILRRSLQQNVHRLFGTIVQVGGALLEQRKDACAGQLFSIDSMTLALLASLTIVLHSSDLKAIVVESQLLPLISGILQNHRQSILQSSSIPGLGEENRISVVQGLHDIACNEGSRAVLRAAAALAHTVCFQSWNLSNDDKRPPSEAEFGCFSVLMNELENIFPLLEDFARSTMNSLHEKRRTVQFEKFCEKLPSPFDSTTTALDTKAHGHQVGRSGVKFLREHGVLTAPHSGSPQKVSASRKSSPSFRPAQETSIRNDGVFCHNYLSHWLNILAAASDSSVSRDSIVDNPSWIEMLLRAVGMQVQFRNDTTLVEESKLLPFTEDILPGRYRSRILRLLFPILKLLEPSEPLVECLFGLAGSTCSSTTSILDEHDGIVSHETVSLLRRLYVPSMESSWRECISSVICASLEQTDDTSLMKNVGILCFFNGAFESIKKGYHVLLKPAAAVPLSAEHQALPSSKGHSSAGGSTGAFGAYSLPHHIVGNGTEGVVAGLCRSQASAGIVSSIDMKNGVCEVILLGRNKSDPDLFETSINGTSRQSLTVRAVRSPLIDVVQAQEVPIFIDKLVSAEKVVPSLLKRSLSVLQNSRHGPDLSKIDSEGSLVDLNSQIMEVIVALMSLRASITLLSDEVVISKFLKVNEDGRKLLSQVLALAYPKDAPSSESKQDLLVKGRNKFMSSFPVHEARLVHIMSLFRLLNFEWNILQGTPQDVWDSRSRDLARQIDEPKKAADVEMGDNSDSPTTPSQQSQVPGSSSSAITEEAERETSDVARGEAATSRTTSQSTAASENSEEEEESEAAAHLQEAAIAQMAELGLPRSWSELALRRTGGTNIEAAVHFCLESKSLITIICILML